MTSPLVRQLVEDIKDMRKEQFYYCLQIELNGRILYSVIFDNLDKLPDILSTEIKLPRYTGSIIDILGIDNSSDDLIKYIRDNPKYIIYQFYEIRGSGVHLDSSIKNGGPQYRESPQLIIIKQYLNKPSINCQDVYLYKKNGMPIIVDKYDTTILCKYDIKSF